MKTLQTGLIVGALCGALLACSEDKPAPGAGKTSEAKPMNPAAPHDATTAKTAAAQAAKPSPTQTPAPSGSPAQADIGVGSSGGQPAALASVPTQDELDAAAAAAISEANADAELQKLLEEIEKEEAAAEPK
jgi:hypothetical protein